MPSISLDDLFGDLSPEEEAAAVAAAKERVLSKARAKKPAPKKAPRPASQLPASYFQGLPTLATPPGYGKSTFAERQEEGSPIAHRDLPRVGPNHQEHVFYSEGYLSVKVRYAPATLEKARYREEHFQGIYPEGLIINLKRKSA